MSFISSSLTVPHSSKIYLSNPFCGEDLLLLFDSSRHVFIRSVFLLLTFPGLRSRVNRSDSRTVSGHTRLFSIELPCVKFSITVSPFLVDLEFPEYPTSFCTPKVKFTLSFGNLRKIYFTTLNYIRISPSNQIFHPEYPSQDGRET